MVQHRLWSVTEWLSQIELGSKGYVVVLDKHGAVVGHPRLNLSTERHEEYAGLEPVKRALKGETLKEEYVDPVSGRAMISWMLPVETSPGTRWVIIAQQDREEALGPLTHLRRQIVVAAGIVDTSARYVLRHPVNLDEVGEELRARLAGARASFTVVPTSAAIFP